MPRSGRVHDAPAADARRHLGKAEEFLEAARLSLGEGHRIAATSLAVHAGIAAGDAITVARLGQRAAGPGHDQARALLDDAGPEGKEASRHLGRILPLKTRSEYDPDDVPAAKRSRRWSGPTASSPSPAEWSARRRAELGARHPTSQPAPSTVAMQQ